MKVKVAEASGPVLDWMVSRASGTSNLHPVLPWKPSTDWSQGGPIIERHITKLEDFAGEGWSAFGIDGAEADGPTPLIAAMRCFVSSKLGDEVDVPEELCQK